jgi:tRNA pseudouridine38-40 synthase
MRLRLEVAYDGTQFFGWAPQPRRRTVAGCLVDAFTKLFGANGFTGLTVAGRTDSGVHATGQVCHLDVEAQAFQRLGRSHGPAGSPTDPADSLVRRLAGLLPPDLRVRAVAIAPQGFDARFSALTRRYEYRVTDEPSGGDPLQRHRTLHWPRRLDGGLLNAASAPLVGEHNFAAFCRRREHATTIRAISELTWRVAEPHIYVATVEADAFCWSMVRSLVGALLAVGDGRRPIEWPAALLRQNFRADEVVVVPAHGLTLVSVTYPATSAEMAARDVKTRNLRLLR